MKKLIIGMVLIFLAMPAILSFVAKHYLQNHFVENFATDLEIEKLDFEHGWFNSKAKLDLKYNLHNLIVETNNQIQHGPVIWSNLLPNPIKAFALYKIETDFDLTNHRTDLQLNDQPGSAITWVDYLGNSNPQINHPGLNLSVLQTRIFADLAQIDAKFNSDGTINALIKSNQLELTDQFQSFYLVKPEVRINLNPKFPFPETINLTAINLSGQQGTDNYQAGGVNLSSQINQADNTSDFQSELKIDLLYIDQAIVSDVTAEFSINNLDQTVVDFISQNYTSISTAMQNNQWLVLLKYFSDLVKLVNHEPEIILNVQGKTEDLPLKFDFSSQLLAHSKTELNPFSLLDNLKAELETSIPKRLVAKLDQTGTNEFLESMLEKGLLIEKHQSYYTSLSFENTKLKTKY